MLASSIALQEWFRNPLWLYLFYYGATVFNQCSLAKVKVRCCFITSAEIILMAHQISNLVLAANKNVLAQLSLTTVLIVNQ